MMHNSFSSDNQITRRKFARLIVISFIMVNILAVTGINWMVQGTLAENSIEVGEPFGFCHAGYSNSETEYTNLNNLGSQWMRVDFSWSSIEPSNNDFDFSRWDAYLDAAEMYGQKVLAILDYDVNWLNITGDYTVVRPYIKPEHIPYFLDYVNHTVRRYVDRVSAFEIWNEPNIHFWKGTQTEFFQLFNATANLIHQIEIELNKDIIIVGASVAGHDPSYISDMFEANLMQFIDAISFHPYSSNVNEIYSKIQELHRVMDKYNFSGELWITEVGNPTGGTYGHRVDEYELSNRVIKTLVYSTALNIEVLIWYCLYDSSDAAKNSDPLNSEYYFGLLYPNNTWKTGAYAFSIFSNLSTNSVYRPDLVEKQSLISSASVQTHLYQRANGETLLVLWYDSINPAETKININLKNLQNISDIIQHDIYNGNQAILTKNHILLNSTAIVLSFNRSILNEDSQPILIEIEDPMYLVAYLIMIPILVIGLGIFFIKKLKN